MGTMQRKKNKALSYGEDKRFLRGKWGKGRSLLLAAVNDPPAPRLEGTGQRPLSIVLGTLITGIGQQPQTTHLWGKTARQGQEWNAVSLAPGLF